MLYITRADYEKMLAHCMGELPMEGCGLIGGVKEGDAWYVKRVYLMSNMHRDQTHFSMEPCGICGPMAWSCWEISIPIQGHRRNCPGRISGMPVTAAWFIWCFPWQKARIQFLRHFTQGRGNR